jgi:hypothetical protein
MIRSADFAFDNPDRLDQGHRQIPGLQFPTLRTEMKLMGVLN